MAETILQHWIVTNFFLPFLLIFFITFGVLEKTKLFGSDKKQLNALIAFVVGLIFVGAIFPKLVVANMVLFLTVALVVMFVALMLFGFVAGEDGLKFSNAPTGLKWVIGILIVAAVGLALFYSTGFEGSSLEPFFDALFGQSWSEEFWINFMFIGVIIAALALVMRNQN